MPDIFEMQNNGRLGQAAAAASPDAEHKGIKAAGVLAGVNMSAARGIAHLDTPGFLANPILRGSARPEKWVDRVLKSGHEHDNRGSILPGGNEGHSWAAMITAERATGKHAQPAL